MIVIDCNKEQSANWEESGGNIWYVGECVNSSCHEYRVRQTFNYISLGENKYNRLVVYKISTEEISDMYAKGVCTSRKGR